MQAILESPVADAAITSAGRGVVLYTVLYLVDLASMYLVVYSVLAGCLPGCTPKYCTYLPIPPGYGGRHGDGVTYRCSKTYVD